MLRALQSRDIRDGLTAVVLIGFILSTSPLPLLGEPPQQKPLDSKDQQAPDPKVVAAANRDAVKRLAMLKQISEQRHTLLANREELQRKMLAVENQLKAANAQFTQVQTQAASVEVSIAQLQSQIAQISQQQQNTADPNQKNNLANMAEQRRAQVPALQNQLAQLNAQAAGTATLIAGLTPQWQEGAVSMQSLYSQADQLRLEWLRLMDPFGELDRDEHEAAISDLTEWTVIDAENAGAFLARGFAYYRIGQSPMAMLDFQRAVQLGGPLLPVALAARGLLLCKSGDGRKGMAEFGRAIKLDKTNGLVYLLRANAFSNDGKFLSAVQDFKMAIQLNAQDAEPHRQLAHLQATCPKTEVRNGKKAVTSAKLACDLTAGTDWRCLDTLAAAQAETGDYGEAVKTSDRAAELAEGKNRNLCLEHKKLFEARQPLRLEDAAAR